MWSQRHVRARPGVHAELQCLQQIRFDEAPVITYHDRVFARMAGTTRHHEHVIFETATTMFELHDRLIGKDKLVAELTLRNDETGDEQKLRTDAISVDLAA
jgi:hypothetical protein